MISLACPFADGEILVALRVEFGERLRARSSGFRGRCGLRSSSSVCVKWNIHGLPLGCIDSARTSPLNLALSAGLRMTMRVL